MVNALVEEVRVIFNQMILECLQHLFRNVIILRPAL